MSIQIASDHMYSTRFEALTGGWEIDPVFHQIWLKEPVEMVGRTTLATLMDLIDQTPILRHFVCGYFDVDLDDIRNSEPVREHDLDVIYEYQHFGRCLGLIRSKPVRRLEVSRNAILDGEEVRIGRIAVNLNPPWAGRGHNPPVSRCPPITVRRQWCPFRNWQMPARCRFGTSLRINQALEFGLVEELKEGRPGGQDRVPRAKRLPLYSTVPACRARVISHP